MLEMEEVVAECAGGVAPCSSWGSATIFIVTSKSKVAVVMILLVSKRPNKSNDV